MNAHCCERMGEDLESACAQHPDRNDCPDALLATVRGGYGIIVHDGGSSVVEIAFCPWCGARLPAIGALEPADG
jgi:hypothetical protein